MSKNMNQALPATQLPLPAFSVQAAPVVERIRAVLSGRAKSCALPVQTTATFTRMVNGKATKRVLEGAKSPLELNAPDKAGNRPHTTFTRDEVRTIARQVVVIMAEKPSPAGVRDRIPSYALGEGASDATLAKVLGLTYTPSKGNNANVELNAAAHCVGSYRAAIRRLAKSNTMTSTLKAGEAWYAEGVKDNKGEPRPYPTEKKARKAYCRLTHGDNWYDTDKADRLKNARVYQQGESLGRTSHNTLNRSVTGTLDDLSPPAIRALAKKAGAPKRIHTGAGATARSRAWFAEDVTRIGVLNG